MSANYAWIAETQGRKVHWRRQLSGKELSALAQHMVDAEDPAEAELPPGGGFVRLRDLESGRDVAVALTAGSRRRYAEAARRRREDLTRAFYRAVTGTPLGASSQQGAPDVSRAYESRTDSVISDQQL